MKKDKDMKRGGIGFQYANNVVAVKWFDNRGVTMVGTCLEECNSVSTVTRGVKGQSAKMPVPCPEISIPVWVLMISSIKKQQLTNWTASRLVGAITLDYFLV